MLQPLSLFIGLRYTLSKRRSRSVSFISGIAMMGIVLSVALLITVLSVMNGFDKELKERILGIMPQVSVYYPANSQEWPALRQHILQQQGVKGATPFIELQGMLHEGRFTQPGIIYGVDKHHHATVSNISNYLDNNTLLVLASDEHTIALGSGLAEKLQVGRDDKVTVIIPQLNQGGSRQNPAVKRLKIIDVFSTGTELDHSLALMGLVGAAQLSPNPLVISGLHISVNNLFEANYISNELKLSLSKKLNTNVYTSDWSRTHGNIYTAIKTSKSLVSLLLFLIIAIAAFNVVSTLMMVVVDKQSDIAVLRTLGVSNRQVLSIFIIQGAIIGVVGTIIGVVLGVFLALTIENIISSIEQLLSINFLQSTIYPVNFLPSSLQLNDIILVASASLIMSFIATIYPAIQAMKINPAEALSYDE
jgi:lipoprotein-releasing system permease protein